eukprot:Nitzschia sp. Nitz4//scaffold86_size83305//47973//48822//NITZ4_005263-RA/size83305-snap-gene-0.171-mRNA-1//-1//CDS//3329559253//1957//frame0
MSFNNLLSNVAGLLSSGAEVADSVPCKTDILTLRECNKGSSEQKCEGLRLDLMQCLAKFRVEATENIRFQIGIAKYNEYVQELEEKHGKEEAAAIIAEPLENLKKVEAAQLLYRLDNNQHPKGEPKTEADLASWTKADQTRFEMGEKAWWDAVRVVGTEFGAEPADRLFGTQQESKMVGEAIERLFPGASSDPSKTLEKFGTLMEPVREQAPANASVEELAAAFKKVYPTKASLA